VREKADEKSNEFSIADAEKVIGISEKRVIGRAIEAGCRVTAQGASK
jgi:hypothetical protein